VAPNHAATVLNIRALVVGNCFGFRNSDFGFQVDLSAWQDVRDNYPPVAAIDFEIILAHTGIIRTAFEHAAKMGQFILSA
jgi:hypothetical protein